MKDLWPTNIGGEVNNSPVSILREQAKLLGQKTNNLVKADVSTGSPTNGKFVYYFYIVAPTLNNYHFRLFTVEHEIEMYPVTVYVDEILGKELDAEPETSKTQPEAIQMMAETILTGTGWAKSSEHYMVTLTTEDEFVDCLSNILSSQRSQQVVSSLLSQVSPDHTPIFL